MAATLTGTGELTQAFFSFPILKTEEDSDGNLIVYGKATDGSVDSDEQIVDPEWAAKAVQEWLDTGPNVRVQHNSQRDPAGVGISMETGPDGETYVKSRVIETEAKRLVKGGALRAYSVGIARPKIVRDNVARGGRIVDGQLVEISLVDRPANKNCGIQLVTKSADGRPQWVGKAFGSDILTKGENTVTVDLPKDVSVSFSPADLAKLLKHREIAEQRVVAGEIVEKRAMDPDVGGGVDRDKIPDADFAGRDRSFPIVTPGDVSDAASSIGRAGEDNYSSDQLKSNIIRIARRKGDSFVAELPEAWKTDLGKAEVEPEVEKKKKGKKPAFAGASKPFGSEDGPDKDDEKATKSGDVKDPDDDNENEKDDEAEPDTTKGMKDCKCGAAYDADAKVRRCTECNAKLPKANKSIEPDAEKKIKSVCQKCGAMTDAKHHFCPECGTSKADALPIKKNHDFMCLGCTKKLDKGEKYCPGCGKENPGYLPMADTKVKNSKPTPTSAVSVVGHPAGSTEPVPEHREPDGAAIEAFEHDAHLPTDPDSNYELKAANRIKSIGAPMGLGMLHDLLCSGYHPADTAKCYPTHSLADVDVNEWQQKALDAAVSAPLAEAGRATQMWQHAVTIKGTDADILEDIRAEAYKEFKDANKGPGAFPMPTELSPTRFKRPYLSDGHSRPSPGHSGPNTHSVPSGQVSASQYGRDFIASGHAEDSPSNKGEAIIEPAPLPPGMGRTYYRNALRDAAKTAMQAMHDHIAQTFPDLCPMGGPGLGGEAPIGQRPVPLPVGKSEMEETVTELAEDMSKKAAKLLAKTNAVRKAAGLPELVEEPAIAGSETEEPTAFAEMLAKMQEQLETVTKAFDEQRERNDKLQRTVEALGDLADPREAPFKGLAQQPVTATKAAGVPAGARTVAENAERYQMEQLATLRREGYTNPDPGQREAAWAQYHDILGRRG